MQIGLHLVQLFLTIKHHHLTTRINSTQLHTKIIKLAAKKPICSPSTQLLLKIFRQVQKVEENNMMMQTAWQEAVELKNNREEIMTVTTIKISQVRKKMIIEAVSSQIYSSRFYQKMKFSIFQKIFRIRIKKQRRKFLEGIKTEIIYYLIELISYFCKSYMSIYLIQSFHAIA